MNVRSLFHYDENIKPEALMHFLDIPESDPKKQAFLEACRQNPRLASAWAVTRRLEKAGKHLNEQEPPARVKQDVLAMARQAAEARSASQVKSRPWYMPQTWQLAAAASFMVLLTGIYMQTRNINAALTYETVTQVESLDQDLYQMQRDLEVLSISMGLERPSEYNRAL